MYKLGLVRVLTIDDQDKLSLHGRLIEEYFSQLKVESRCIEDQYTGIHNEETEEKAIPKILKLAKEWDDIDALVVSCAGDPGIGMLREELDISVIGAGESTALLSKRFGNKYGIIGLNTEPPKSYIDILDIKNIVGDGKIEGVDSTLDLEKDGAYDRILEKSLSLKEKGAEVIVIACTGIATMGISRQLEGDLGIPVVDPVLAEGLIALYECIRRDK